MGSNSDESSVREEIENSISQLTDLIQHSLRSLPTQTGDGTYVMVDDDSKETGILKDLGNFGIKDIETLTEITKTSLTGELVNDRNYIMERLIQLASSLPSTSRNGIKLTNSLLSQLWNDLKHPPISYLAKEFVYRQADGSNNNILWPQLGVAGSSYARTVQPKSVQPGTLPDPGALFDSLMVRKEFKPHPNKISSMLFYLASIIIHDLFKTDHRDTTRSMTSSYLDLAPLYGSNQDEQNAIRAFKDGMVKPDCFSEKRILGFPPGVGVLLIMFNRFHNYVVLNLAKINEGGRFNKPDEKNTEAYAKYDNDLFQTGRLITCGLYINCILKDYVRTILNINRSGSDWDLDPRAEISKSLFGEDIAQAGGNQVSAEFNLVYRWHSCVSERDDKWTRDTYKELFPGKDPDEISMSEFLRGLGQWEANLPADPQQRPFAQLKRLPNGSFNDDELVEILALSIEDCAGPFGASQVPAVFRAVEILGIEQSRSWNLASLNEFRKYFGLTPHETFEDINSDPYIADQLRHLYDHPDHVEMYPGLVVEEAKESMVPGSGLCASFTISRAILSDAVALVRGDRFYTVDYTPRVQTNWGYKEASYDLATDHGQVFYKLFLRAFPHHFKADSVYAHFPLVIPSENKKILSDLGDDGDYSWDRPGRIAQPTMINSYAACKSILENQKDFKVTWGKAIEYLMHNNDYSYGKDFMLSGDEAPNAASRKMVSGALYHETWYEQVKEFYEHITLKLLHEKSYKIAGVNQVDIVRDVINLAQVHFCSGVFSLPLKTEDNPRGVYTETELYGVLALVFICIFFDADPAKSFPLQQQSRKLTQQFGQLVMLNVRLIDKTGFLADILDRLYKHEGLSNYGIHMIRRLLDSGLPADQVVWTHMLPTAGGMVANQAQLFSQCLDYYLSEEGSVYLPEINRLANLDTKEADDLIMRYFLEGARLRSAVALYRDLATEATIDDGGKEVKLQPGDRVVCNLSAASKDPNAFPDPTKVDLTRDLDSYIHLGIGPHRCLGYGVTRLALSTMLKTVGKLDNLRRAPGPQGQLKMIPGPGGISLYMTAEHDSYSPFPSTMKVQWDGDIPALK